jgi:molybdopterin-guanine dinucleotide biosynthesis protein A
MKASGAVLVGGKSRRMGIDKPLIPIGGQRLIERVVGTLAQVVEEVLLVGQGAARLSWLGLPCIEDLLPGGPLAGIYTALAAARHPHCLIVACDMPFLDPPLLAYLLEQAPGWDVVVPYMDGHLEPLHAVYTRSCQEVVGEMLARGETCPLDLYPRVRTRYVGPEEIAGFPGAGAPSSTSTRRRNWYRFWNRRGCQGYKASLCSLHRRCNYPQVYRKESVLCW